MKNNFFEKSNELLDSLYFYRLKIDLDITEEKLKENELLDLDKSKNAIVRFWNKNIENSLRSDELKKHNENKAKILQKVDNFMQKHKNFDYSFTNSEQSLKKYIDEFLKAENGQFSRINLALLSILQNKEFIYSKQSIESISKVLFCDKTKINEIEKDLEKNYLKIAGKTSYDEIGKKVLLGIGLATAFSCFGLGLWASVGISILDIAGVSALYALLVVGASGIIYKLIDSGKKDDILIEFRKLSSEDVGAMFAVRATLIEEAKKYMTQVEFNEFLDSSLKLISDLRADTEYLLLVEKQNVEESKKKIKTFNNLTNRLSTIIVG